MKILTWNDDSQDGAFQNEQVDGIFSDKITVKPTLSFPFTNLQYISIANTYRVDDREMTLEEKAEIESTIMAVEPPASWVFDKRTIGSKQFLQTTDWYIIRKVELGIEIPTDIATQRQSARDLINNQKVALNYTPPQAQL